MSCPGATRLVHLELKGPAGPLEAVLRECDSGSPAFAALVCHPHPLYGGTLHNKVVHRVASVLHDAGGAALRFNFRGVGRSAGRFDRGMGELDDARIALDWLRERHPDTPLWAAGFSFGSWIAARLGAGEPDVARLILVAPPVATASFEALRAAPVPKLVLQGTRDEVCPLAALEREFPSWAEPKALLKVEGATHFFDRRLGALAEVLLQALPAHGTGGTSSIT
ncbi:MAG: alpha/beta fold hydrolase [Candidatus Eisenbacteria bacterium]|nr:alpha/beta fold hydrolase [Candidatus Eisenbacteria bacterium]